jgi:hypothetical protein
MLELGGGFSESDRDVETEAIDREALQLRFRRPHSLRRAEENRGMNLEVVMADGLTVPVEVEGRRGDNAFMITRSERKSASRYEYSSLNFAIRRQPSSAVSKHRGKPSAMRI